MKRNQIKKIIFVLALTSLSVFALYHLVLTERIETVVEGRIYRSAQLPDSSLQKIISEKGIRTIINLRGGNNNSEWYIRELRIVGRNNVRLYDISFPAHELPEYGKLISLIDALETTERPVLIHCRRGADRTGMASALAIAIEKDPPLSSVKRQFSWRYGVFPFRRSIGPYLFSKYEEWLSKTGKTHSRDILLYWIRNEYNHRGTETQRTTWVSKKMRLPRTLWVLATTPAFVIPACRESFFKKDSGQAGVTA